MIATGNGRAGTPRGRFHATAFFRGKYLGRAKAEMQAAWAATLVNLNPIGEALGAEAA